MIKKQKSKMRIHSLHVTISFLKRSFLCVSGKAVNHSCGGSAMRTLLSLFANQARPALTETRFLRETGFLAASLMAVTLWAALDTSLCSAEGSAAVPGLTSRPRLPVPIARSLQVGD